MNPNFKFFLCKSALWHEFCHACGSLRSGSRTYERTLINVSDIIRENKFNYTVNSPIRRYFLAVREISCVAWLSAHKVLC